jgi:hypothetical protein
MSAGDSTKSPGNGNGPEGEADRLALEAIQQALRGLRFGEVRVIVHDGLVVQVERLERRRLDRGTK